MNLTYLLTIEIIGDGLIKLLIYTKFHEFIKEMKISKRQDKKS